MPLSRKVAIDEEAFLKIIDQMRITIPLEVKQGREVQDERDRYIAQAHDEARRVIAQARQDAARLLDENIIRREAEVRARQIEAEAEEEARHVRAGADEYAEAKLRELAQHVGELHRVVQNGLRLIDGRRAALNQPTPAPAAALAASQEEARS
ncbi:MAG: hypothetical protein V1772_10175 [Chloroflexota bacterium]